MHLDNKSDTKSKLPLKRGAVPNRAIQFDPLLSLDTTQNMQSNESQTSILSADERHIFALILLW
jgi:hypothetical protein